MKTLTPRRVQVSDLQADIFAPVQPLDRVTQPRAGKHHRDARPTELKAALKIAPKAGTQRFEVLRRIGNAGLDGLTQWEIVNLTGFLRSSVAPRVKELVEGGWIEDSKRERKEQTGSHAVVWIATDRGRRFLREQARRRA